MRVSAAAMVLGVESRQAKDKSGNNRVYSKVLVFVAGEDMGATECNVPEDRPQVLADLKNFIKKEAVVTLNIRTYKGTTFVDCVGVGPIK